jgi:hypothetical protein
MLNNPTFFFILVHARKEFKWTIKDLKELYEIGKPIVSSTFEVFGPGLVTPEAFFLEVEPIHVTLKFSIDSH